ATGTPSWPWRGTWSTRASPRWGREPCSRWPRPPPRPSTWPRPAPRPSPAPTTVAAPRWRPWRRPPSRTGRPSRPAGSSWGGRGGRPPRGVDGRAGPLEVVAGYVAAALAPEPRTLPVGVEEVEADEHT